ncbi:glycosyltransferase family 39 protein [Patescibacteria group bacterium]|nr:glycosyltransferase family 39 protein [Patescibacteria group bacterium]
MSFIRGHKVEIFLIVLSLGVHLASFAALTQENGSVLQAVRADDGYYELAQNIIAGNGFSWSTEAPYAPNPLRTPGYSYVLAGLIATFGVFGAALIQLVAASAIPVFGMMIARAITESRTIGILTGVILAVDPTLSLLSFQFYTDTLFLLLFLPWLILTLRYFTKPSMTTLILSALLLGAAILVRPVAQFIPIIMVPLILWHLSKTNWQHGVAHVGVFLVLIGAILAPWILRNVNEFGVPAMSAQTPFVLYTNLAPAVLSIANGTDFLSERDAFLTPEEYKGDAITPANGSTYTKKALNIALTHPSATLFVAAKSLFTFFTNDGFYSFLVQIGYNPNNFLPLLIGARLVWVAITISAVVGACIYLFTKRTPQTLLIVLLLAYFALTSTIAAFGTNPRYRLPVDPIIIALAGAGITEIIARGQRLRVSYLQKKADL